MGNTFNKNIDNQKKLSFVKRFFAFHLEPRSYNLEAGLTLIELMAAITIFTATVAVTMGVFLNIVISQKRSQNTMNIENTAYFAMETIAKEIRTGENFSCASGLESDCYQLQFINYHGDEVSYELSGSQIQKNCTDSPPTGDCATGAISASALEASYLRFVLEGVAEFDNKQPRITIVLEMKTPASAPAGQARDIKLQTTISSRQSDS